MTKQWKDLTYDEIIEFSNNKSYADIISIHSFLQESIRHYLSRLLSGTSEGQPLECNLVISTPEDMGLSDLEKPTVEAMYQDNEGIIWLQTDGNPNWIELDQYVIDYQLAIIKAIEEQLC